MRKWPLLVVLLLAGQGLAQEEDEETGGDPTPAAAPADEGWADTDSELEPMAAGSGAAAPVYKLTDLKITLQGAKLADVVDEINARPNQEAGSYFCKGTVSVKGGTKDGKQVVTSCQAKVNCERSLPVWTNRGSRPATAQQEWDRFAGAIGTHEQGHFDRMKPVYDGLCGQILGKERDEVAELVSAANEKAQAISDKYDTDTTHGATQGCTLDTSKDP